MYTILKEITKQVYNMLNKAIIHVETLRFKELSLTYLLKNSTLSYCLRHL